MEQGRLWNSSFRERFCERYHCEPSAFEERAFFKCVPLRVWPLAKILFRRDPGIFKEDLEFMRELGGIRDPLIFKSELNRYHGRNVRERGFIRGFLGVRVSGKRAIKLKNRLFRAA
jgi:hypothetical protein